MGVVFRDLRRESVRLAQRAEEARDSRRCEAADVRRRAAGVRGGQRHARGTTHRARNRREVHGKHRRQL